MVGVRSSPPPLLFHTVVVSGRAISPGPYQTYLDVGTKYRRVDVDERRLALGAFKEKLNSALKLGEDEGAALSFLRVGVAAKTWWEADEDIEESDLWRQ